MMNTETKQITISSQQKSIFEKARLSRDARFDGKFFVAVKTTRIFCRPICPVKLPLTKNIDFYLSSAQALEAGYRPCLRCRPEASPENILSNLTNNIVNDSKHSTNNNAFLVISDVLEMIENSDLEHLSVQQIALDIGFSSRHLSRIFQQYMGISIGSLLQSRRIIKAKYLLNFTRLSMTDTALLAGYISIRQFNAHFQKVYKTSPTQLRQQHRSDQTMLAESSFNNSAYQLSLHYRPPYDFRAMLEFLDRRAIPGVEHVDLNLLSYARSIIIDEQLGFFRVSQKENEHALLCEIWFEKPKFILHILNRIKLLFDIEAEVTSIIDVLSQDEILKKLMSKDCHQSNKQNLQIYRIPGAWSPFEIAVRAIVGQQVSVKGATTIMGRLASEFGKSIRDVTDQHDLLSYADELKISHVFADAQSLARLDPSLLSMPTQRANAIKELSLKVSKHIINFDMRKLHENELIDRLLSIKGIGLWTAQYIAMRALRDPDAFLSGDLVLQKKAAVLLDREQRLSDKELDEMSQNWRPWRAYAAMLIWNS